MNRYEILNEATIDRVNTLLSQGWEIVSDIVGPESVIVKIHRPAGYAHDGTDLIN